MEFYKKEYLKHEDEVKTVANRKEDIKDMIPKPVKKKQSDTGNAL